MAGASKLLALLRNPFSRACSRYSALRFARQPRVSLDCISSAQNLRFCSNYGSLLGFSINPCKWVHTQSSNVYSDDFHGESRDSRVWDPLPEWLKMVESLKSSGYFDRQCSSVGGEYEFVGLEDLSEEVVQAMNASLAFARDHPDLLGSLSWKDISVVVENGSPSLFKNADESIRRMKSFIGGNGSRELEYEKAHTVDLMRFLLSYACGPNTTSDGNNSGHKELIESSVRNLLSELANAIRTVRELDFSMSSNSSSRQFPDRYGQTSRPHGQNIEMKRGDWICPKCNFMNFAKNMKCLECEEGRPKRVLTGGEWDCPQCGYFNYGRNTVCFKCDCQRPVEASHGTSGSTYGLGYNNGSNTADVNIMNKLAANEEKAERWFGKVSQLDSASDLSREIADDDFPEIMPLRKGGNRFVVSTRKTPLERRLADAQYRRSLGNDGIAEGSSIHAEDMYDPAKTSDASVSQSLDRILGRSSALSEKDNNLNRTEENVVGRRTGENSPFSGSTAPQNWREESIASYTQPLPTDMFAKSHGPKIDEVHKYNSVAAKVDELIGYSATENAGPRSLGEDNSMLSGKPLSQAESKEDREQAEKSERWFKKVAEVQNVTDLASAISDEDFPEIMPMRKGENHFVISKKKDRSFTSTPYKRRMAMEQASNTNFVPFVPFPADYFAKKDKQQDSGTSKDTPHDGSLAVSATPEIRSVHEKMEHEVGVVQRGDAGYSTESSRERWDTGFSTDGLNQGKVDSTYAVHAENSYVNQRSAQASNMQSWNRGSFQERSGGFNLGVQTANVSQDGSQAGNRQIWNSGSFQERSGGFNPGVLSATSTVNLDSSHASNMQSWNNGSSQERSGGFNLGGHSGQQAERWDTGSPAHGFPESKVNSAFHVRSESSTVRPYDPQASNRPSWNGGSYQEMPGGYNMAGNAGQQQPEKWNSGFATGGLNERKLDSPYGTENSTIRPYDSQTNHRQSWNNSSSQVRTERSQQSDNAQTNKVSWNGGFTGKSLEGSAVKELDPLDMSEEAKAERWFRRVAQIKDISELSNIPDEDFPEIMPMRKGVNRFVVSKRKTPLERRLTSPQYRRNLPIVSSEPIKKDTDTSEDIGPRL